MSLLRNFALEIKGVGNPPKKTKKTPTMDVFDIITWWGEDNRTPLFVKLNISKFKSKSTTIVIFLYIETQEVAKK